MLLSLLSLGLPKALCRYDNYFVLSFPPERRKEGALLGLRSSAVDKWGPEDAAHVFAAGEKWQAHFPVAAYVRFPPPSTSCLSRREAFVEF